MKYKIDHTCIKCGKHEQGDWGGGISERMLELTFCFSCHHWWEKVQKKDHPKIVRVDGTHYYVGENNGTPAKWKGHAGAKFTIKFKDGRVVNTDNLWHNGDIPKEWKDQLPDNAEFLTNVGEIAAEKLEI